MKIYFGYDLLRNGIIRANTFQKSDLTGAYAPISVRWNGAPAELRFWNYRGLVPLNQVAMGLIMHPDFTIRGDAKIITHTETWHALSSLGSENLARSKLAHVEHTFIDKVIYKPAGRHKTHTNVCARNMNDAFAIRMVI